MKRLIAFAVVAVLTLALLGLGPVPAGAAHRNLGWTMTPVKGAAGTVITATSVIPSPAPEGTTNPYVEIVLWSKATRNGHAGATILAAANEPIAADGSWSVHLTVPAANTGRHVVMVKAWTHYGDSSAVPYQDYFDNAFSVTK
jgi:hypothetical protein